MSIGGPHEVLPPHDVAHYNHVRPHQTLELWAPDDRRPRSPPRSEGQVVGRPILGGLHHEYERLAA